MAFSGQKTLAFETYQVMSDCTLLNYYRTLLFTFLYFLSELASFNFSKNTFNEFANLPMHFSEIIPMFQRCLVFIY